MCGSAMFTIVPSSTTMSWAALMTASAIPRLRGAEPPVSPESMGAAVAATGSGSATSSVGWGIGRPFTGQGRGRAGQGGQGQGRPGRAVVSAGRAWAPSAVLERVAG